MPVGLLFFELNVLEPGDYFGEQSLLSDEPRNASIAANRYVLLFRLDKKDFQQIFGDGKVQFIRAKRKVTCKKYSTI